MKKYKCSVCGYIYNPEVGDSEAMIAAGTSFEELPVDWTCPLCRVDKKHFCETDIAQDEIERPESDEAARNRKIADSEDLENIAPQNGTRIEEAVNDTDYDNNGSCNI